MRAWSVEVATACAPGYLVRTAVFFALVVFSWTPSPAIAQTMPGPAYHDLLAEGHERLARDLTRLLDLRAQPDPDDVREFLDRWKDDAEGPRSGNDWLAVARMWLRAGDAGRAESALERAQDRVPEPLFLIDRARIAFLRGDVSGTVDYWAACAIADETASSEIWLDIEILATPDELAAWGGFRTLPAGDRDDCAFFRRFWNRRAAASGMDVDERILAHYERTRFALENYRRRGRVRPRFSARLGRPTNSVYDDRGLLYVRMGDPSETAMHGGSDCIEPNISWAYDRPGGYWVYHLSPLGGADDWYLLENLAMVYRCGSWDRNPMVAISPLLLDVPGPPFHDLYMSRMGLDPRYARIANHALNLSGDDFASSRLAEELTDERDWTWQDGESAVAGVPEQPAVDMSVAFGLEWLQFRAPRPGLTRTWLNGLVDASALRPVEVDGRDLYRVEAVWSLLDETGLTYRQIASSFDLPVDGPLDDETGLSLRKWADLPQGTYRWILVVSDANSTVEDDGETVRGGFASGNVVVRDLGTDLPVLSDVAVSPDSTGAWSPVAGISLNPTPARTTGDDGVAYIYYEAYNLTAGGRYETRVVLQPEGGGQSFDLSYPGTALRGASIVTRGHLRIDLSDSSPGRYEVSVSVRDLTSGHVTLPVQTHIIVSRD
jgi:GWxTD domain-containing protein